MLLASELSLPGNFPATGSFFSDMAACFSLSFHHWPTERDDTRPPCSPGGLPGFAGPFVPIVMGGGGFLGGGVLEGGGLGLEVSPNEGGKFCLFNVGASPVGFFTG